MTMFLGIILDEGITAPKKISNSLPPGVIYRDGKYYRENTEGLSKELAVTTNDTTSFHKISTKLSKTTKHT